MAELGNYPTLQDITRMLNPNGSIETDIADYQAETNEILQFIPYQETNQTMSELVTVWDTEPDGEWFQYNDGFTTDKATSTQFEEICGMLGRYTEVDYELMKLNNFSTTYRFNQEKRFISGLSKQMAAAFFYSNNSTNRRKPHGLSPRYSTISSDETNIGYNILSGGGSASDNTSMWLIGFSPETVYGIYPKGSKAGIQVEDKGRVTKEVTVGGVAKMREVLRSYITWYTGFAVKNWKYAVRIANIDKSDLGTAGDSTDNSCNLIKLMIQAIDRIPTDMPVKLAFFARQHVHTALKVKLLDRGNMFLGMDDFTTGAGIVRKKLSFMGIPVCRVDQLLDNESVVTT